MLEAVRFIPGTPADTCETPESVRVVTPELPEESLRARRSEDWVETRPPTPSNAAGLGGESGEEGAVAISEATGSACAMVGAGREGWTPAPSRARRSLPRCFSKSLSKGLRLGMWLQLKRSMSHAAGTTVPANGSPRIGKSGILWLAAYWSSVVHASLRK